MRTQVSVERLCGSLGAAEIPAVGGPVATATRPDSRPRALTGSGRQAARMLAYDLLIDCQMTTGASSARTALLLADDARTHGWLDVLALATYTAIVGQRLHDPKRRSANNEIAAFVDWAETCDDPFAVALSLTARAGADLVADRHDTAIDDLVRAYAAAERVDARVERAFALHEIAVGFHKLRMWELAADLFDTVAELSADLREPRALVGSLAANRFYTATTEVLHAIEAGDADRITGLAGRAMALASRPIDDAIPEAWRSEIAALRGVHELLLRPEDATAAEVHEMLSAAAPGRVTQITGLMRCALGWYHLETGRLRLAEPLVRHGSPQILASNDPSFRSFALWMRARLHNGDIDTVDLGTLSAYHTALRHTVEQSRRASSRSAQARLQTERLRVERDRYAYESQTDPLTGIANRRALESRLRALTSPATMIIVDIDRFKPVNDRFGHEVGDRVLRRIGQILRDCVRPGDLAARLGGDEFVLVLETADAEAAVRRGHEVRDLIRCEPWHAISHDLTVAASVGIACGQTGHVALYRAADQALYDAKHAGRARVRARLYEQRGANGTGARAAADASRVV